MSDRKLKPSEVMSNYKNIPADINIYTRESEMKDYPEVTLWDFRDQSPDKDYDQWAYDIGSDLTTEYDAKPLSKIDINE